MPRCTRSITWRPTGYLRRLLETFSAAPNAQIKAATSWLVSFCFFRCFYWHCEDEKSAGQNGNRKLADPLDLLLHVSGYIRHFISRSSQCSVSDEIIKNKRNNNSSTCFFRSHSTRLLAATTLRNVLGTRNLAEILSERESISRVSRNLFCSYSIAALLGGQLV